MKTSFAGSHTPRSSGVLKAIAIIALISSGEAVAQDNDTLKIGMAAPATTLDPHTSSNAPNNAVHSHIYDALITNDAESKSEPGLAVSWQAIDETHWIFKLRQNVKFSDGSAFDAQDVIASFNRAMTIPAIASYRAYTRTIESITSPSPDTVVVQTKGPDPILLNSLSRIRIISSEFEKVPSSDFDSGKAAIGTGPFKLVSYSPGSEVRLARNDGYWGPRPDWVNVTLRMIVDNGARLAGLLSGELGLVEALPFEGIEQVSRNGKLKVVDGLSSRIVFVALNVGSDSSKYMRDNEGKPLAKNPLKDIRVRKALALAINREGLVSRIMQGHAKIADQYLPAGMEGTSPNITATPFDIKQAKHLLTEAGYPDGFQITLQGPNGRYVNDIQVVQALAQMFSRIGIKADVDVMPWSVYAGRGTDVGVFLRSWGVNSGETSNPINTLNATYDETQGAGGYNYGRISDNAIDEPLRRAMTTLDVDVRKTALASASEAVFNNHYILPLYYEYVLDGAQKHLQVKTRFDGYTLAQDIHSK